MTIFFRGPLHSDEKLSKLLRSLYTLSSYELYIYSWWPHFGINSEVLSGGLFFKNLVFFSKYILIFNVNQFPSALEMHNSTFF